MNARAIATRIAKHYDPYRNVVIPNLQAGPLNWEADLTIIRKSLWAEEVEIKVSYSDFRADFTTKKDKHGAIVRGHFMACRADTALERTEGIEATVHDSKSWKYTEYRDWRNPSKHKCKKFWFAMPEPLAAKCLPEIPEYAGLYSVEDWRVRVIKEAPTLKMARPYTHEEMTAVLKRVYIRFCATKWHDGGLYDAMPKEAP